MDNLTHSLIGAVLGQAGLKRKSGLGMPTLIIAANIPDIDATCAALGTVSLAMRRGITHGPIAMLVLPLLLTGAMLWFDRWQTRRGTRPEERLPVRPGWLLALAYIGCLSHPLFDWMNSYGIRLLEPFSHRWFYGDALFIVDPWLLAMLIAGVWFSRRRERTSNPNWGFPARAMAASVMAYIALNLVISHLAVQRFLEVARVEKQPTPSLIVANPVPLAFWKREVLWQGVPYGTYAFGSFLFDARSSMKRRPYQVAVFGGESHPKYDGSVNCMGDPNFARLVTDKVKGNPEAQAFLFWSRMPVVAREEPSGICKPDVLRDQRFMDSMTSSRFQVRLEP